MTGPVMVGLLAEVRLLIDDGGWVMVPLVVATFALWYVLGDRLLRLGRRPLREAARRARAVAAQRPVELRPRLDEALADLTDDLGRGRAAVRAIVTLAPLAGLLGTVGGMIETFDSLGDGALFAQTGGVAGGIAQALLTTQMGLAVAVPGLIAGRLLDRRQRRLEGEVERIKARVTADAGMAEVAA